MRTANLKDMVKGWFIGDFDPTLIRTQDVEVAVKEYKAGDKDERHYHKIATEITVILSGEVEMNGQRYKENDIIIIEPGEDADFTAITDSKNVVVKLPGAKDDKYLGKMEEKTEEK